MSNLRRFDPQGRPVFITCVTFDRRAFLHSHSRLVLKAWRTVASEDIELIAWVLMPDHLHALIDFGLHDMSKIVHHFKQKFSALYRMRYQTTSGRLWQNRYWDHIIRDERDFNRRIDYIHNNPVRHKYSTEPSGWRYSSFRDWLSRGVYSPDWGAIEQDSGREYGE